MIERIEIAGCTSYGDTAAVMDGLRVVNFIYGANGAGKTTLSRLIADVSPFSKCVVSWRNNHKLQPLVYNRWSTTAILFAITSARTESSKAFSRLASKA